MKCLNIVLMLMELRIDTLYLKYLDGNIYIGRYVMMCSTWVTPFLETGIMKMIWTGLRFGMKT